MRKELIALSVIVYFLGNVNSQEFENTIDSLNEKAVQLNRFNGSVLVSKNGRIIYEKAFGYQDLEKNTHDSSSIIYPRGFKNNEFTVAIILRLVKQHQLIINLLTSDNYMTHKEKGCQKYQIK